MLNTWGKSAPISDRMQQFRIFIQVAELASFSGAARTLNLPPATVSAAIQMLEKGLAVRLLYRTTRQVNLTTEGLNFLPLARKMVSEFDEVHHAFHATRQAVAGKFTLDAPSRIATQLIVPALPVLLSRHPALELHVRGSDRPVDLAREGIDCVIRVGEPRDEGLLRKPMGTLQMVHCASPAYLARHPAPKTLDELEVHWVVGYAPAKDMAPGAWTCMDASGVTHRRNLKHRVVAGDVESYLASCLAGMGLIQVPFFDVQHLLRSGELVEVLPEFPPPTMPVAALYLQRHQRSPRMAVVLDWLQGLISRVVAS